MKKFLITMICFLSVSSFLFSQEMNDSENKMKVAAYLYFEYNAREAIETYKSIFNAKVVRKDLFSEEMTKNPKLIGHIFHAELKMGELNFYISDCGEEPSFSSIKFVVEISDRKEVHKYFDMLAEDGKIISEFKEMPFGPKIGEVVDKF